MPSVLGWGTAIQAGTGSFAVDVSDANPQLGCLVLFLAVRTDAPSFLTDLPMTSRALTPPTQMGTRSMLVCADVYSGAPFTFTKKSPSAANSIMYVTVADGAELSELVAGTVGVRNVTGTSTTNVAPGVSAEKDSLVVTFSAEATTAAEPWEPTVSGSSKFAYRPQTTSGTISVETLIAAQLPISSSGLTSPVTITYPNTQANNGSAVQIVVPKPKPLGPQISFMRGGVEVPGSLFMVKNGVEVPAWFENTNE